jgi:hypothetical protein
VRRVREDSRGAHVCGKARGYNKTRRRLY